MNSSAGCLGCLTILLLTILSIWLFQVGLPALGLLIAALLFRDARGFAVAFGVSAIVAFWPLFTMRSEASTMQTPSGGAFGAVLPLILTAFIFLLVASRESPRLATPRALSACLLTGYVFVGGFMLIWVSLG